MHGEGKTPESDLAMQGDDASTSVITSGGYMTGWSYDIVPV